MPWLPPTEYPTTSSEADTCQAEGCRDLAMVRFTSIFDAVDRRDKLIRTTVRCHRHAAELRAELASKAAAVPIPPPTPTPEAPHHCHAVGCMIEVEPRLLMCPRHWRMVPKPIQAQVWAHYRPGQEIDKRPTTAYLDVMEVAIAAVQMRESEPKKLPQLFVIPPDAVPTTCTTCMETIVFVKTEKGKRQPVEVFGEHRGHSHFIYCKQADQHRKRA